MQFCTDGIFFFACCSKSPTQEHTWDVDASTLSVDTVSTYPYLFQSDLIFRDGLIMSVDPQNAETVFAVDTRTGQKTYYSTSDSLRGLNPAVFPFSFYHFVTGKYYQYTLQEGHLTITKHNFRFRGLKINRVNQISKDKYVMLGFFRKGLFGLYNTKRPKEMTYHGRYPLSVPLPPDRHGMESIVQDFQGEMDYSAEHARVVYCSSSFAYISCYKVSGSELKFEWEHHIIPPPEVSVIGGLLKRDTVSMRGGFLDVKIAGKYIFALYGQRDIANPASIYERNLLVFDINGVCLATYPVDFPLSQIAVDLEEKTIYGRSYADVPIIVRLRFDRNK